MFQILVEEFISFANVFSPSVTKAPIHCVKPDTGARMATVMFSLFSNAHYLDSVVCQKKLYMPRMTCRHSFFWLDVQFSPKPPGNGDSKVPEI